MIKFASGVLIFLIVALVRYGMVPDSKSAADSLNIIGFLIGLWLAALALYLGWKLILIMVRQLGEAARGK